MDDYQDLSREELIALVNQYEMLTNQLIERMQMQEFATEEEDELTPFQAKMLKILEFYIRNSASTSRSRAWGSLFNNFGFKNTLEFARWGSSQQNPIKVKGAKEIRDVFAGNEEPEILKQAGISPKNLFTSIRWKR